MEDQLNIFEKLSERPPLRVAGHRTPPAGSGHRCVADNTNLYVFGGYNADGDLFREMWRYHFATSTWQQIRTEGFMITTKPLAVLHGNNLFVFGGYDVHVFNVKYKRWSLLNCRWNKPDRIIYQAMAIINGFLYVLGGTPSYIFRTDVHRLDLTTREWIHLKPNNPQPGERYACEIAHDGQRIYILGGGTHWTSYPLDKIDAYNLETNSWEEIATKPHDGIGYPATRRYHSCVQIRNDVFLCGGRGGHDGELILADLWKMNLQTFQWTRLPAVMPEPAYLHCAAVTPAGCMYIHGGVVNTIGNTRTGSLYKICLVVPSLLELCWERLLKAYPHLAQLSTMQLLNLGLTQELIERLK